MSSEAKAEIDNFIIKFGMSETEAEEIQLVSDFARKNGLSGLEGILQQKLSGELDVKDPASILKKMAEACEYLPASDRKMSSKTLLEGMHLIEGKDFDGADTRRIALDLGVLINKMDSREIKNDFVATNTPTLPAHKP